MAFRQCECDSRRLHYSNSEGTMKRRFRKSYFGTFRERKADRTAYYLKNIFGWRQRDCTACAGSGHYDHDGSPPCGGCDGTGKEFYRGPKAAQRVPA